MEMALARASFCTTRSWFSRRRGGAGSLGSGGALAGSAENRLANASAKPAGYPPATPTISRLRA